VRQSRTQTAGQRGCLSRFRERLRPAFRKTSDALRPEAEFLTQQRIDGDHSGVVYTGIVGRETLDALHDLAPEIADD
jgi:hypothetical protein